MPHKTFVERIIAGVGSVPSLVLHTLIFMFFFLSAFTGTISWGTMLLVLTTIVSLEAIYLAIFIQMTVNRQAHELAEVSEDVEDIQEDIEEISQDVDEIQKDVEEINEEDEAEEQEDDQQAAAIKQLTQDVQRVLADLEHLKKG
ncbi:MAG: hypothetical protein WCS97_01775 [Candidatus Paceibacterota bacterium]|jgi:peptidoglycan hydrolase CwlO-like protein